MIPDIIKAPTAITVVAKTDSEISLAWVPADRRAIRFEVNIQIITFM